MDASLKPIADALLAAGANVGLGLTANALYDRLKARFGGSEASPAEIASEVSNFAPHLSVVGITTVAQAAINVLAQRGDIVILESHLTSPDAITMGSAPGTSFTFGDGSVSTAGKSTMAAGKGMRMVGSGGASVRQNPDGSVDFLS